MAEKLIVKSGDTSEDQPPYLAVGTIHLDNVEIEFEYQLVQAINYLWGEGSYTVFSKLGARDFKLIWKGDIGLKDDRISYYVEESNFLEYELGKIKEKPVQEGWKSCEMDDFVDIEDVKLSPYSEYK